LFVAVRSGRKRESNEMPSALKRKNGADWSRRRAVAWTSTLRGGSSQRYLARRLARGTMGGVIAVIKREIKTPKKFPRAVIVLMWGTVRGRRNQETS